MKQTIQLRLGQQLTMTPQLQQAIRLLQLSTFDLQKEIQEALESNLMLEDGEDGEDGECADAEHWELDDFAEPGADIAPVERAVEREVQPDANAIPDELPVDTRWDDLYESSLPSGSRGGEDEDVDPFLHQSRPQTLQDHLHWQLNLSRLSERDRLIAEAIIDSIDAQGYLRGDLGELPATLDEPSLGAEEILAVLHHIQSFDPPGVGARDLAECLLIQLRQLPATTAHRDLAIAICQQGFAHLPRNDIGALARLLKAPESDIVAALELVRTLNPRPGSLIAGAPPEYLVPDIFVRRDADRWVVELNPEIAPRLRINAEYARLIRRADTSADISTLRSHLQEARWFIKSLASRNDTVLRVGAKIVELQQDFFEHGEEAMRPMVLRDIAEALDLHESTVSRVTTQKYMHTPRGTFEFKYFFSSHLTTTSGGECSSTAIRALIRKLIAAESAQRPLSDSKIATKLAQRGVNVARRTVAKYREAMGIPPSNERKRLA